MGKPAMKKRIVSVVGARPNFMKIAPLHREFSRYDFIEHIIVHTGQHYDAAMSGVFFEQLGLPSPTLDLGVGSGGHGEMTGRIMIEFEKACMELKPDFTVVVGDVNSTIAASLVARKLFIPVAHVEAGLRSFDETMPEELNRRLTDCLSNLLFVSEPSGVKNLHREGADPSRIHLVGDIMLETLQMFLPAIRATKRYARLGLEYQGYGLVTLHRPSNVDSAEALSEVIDILESISTPAVFPIHPRTLKRAETFGLLERLRSVPGLKLIPPEPYIEFLSLLEAAQFVMSDSGSIQSESALFNVPCLTARENTERPIYVELGTTTLVGRSREKVSQALDFIRQGEYKRSRPVIEELGRDVGKKITALIAEYVQRVGP
jgi:UDP-N-acetylglucosamine 2-epimerase (non-hydrolysing)